ncbi:MAG TPA: helix-turn-helix transcriptional regulator [Gammaproteobacteria bacterium]|nr:helix-turn-helix transcriptional regulator [Gammaproteobacteria bacterium]
MIRTEREKRAWSQEHLAEVAGLGLRTIQRIESTGSAAYESARALAAVFEMDVARLRVAVVPPALTPDQPPSAPAGEPSERSNMRRRFGLLAAPRWVRPLYAAATLVAIGGALLLTRSSFADQIQLDVGVSIDDQKWERRMVVDEGALVPNLTRDGVLRYDFMPTKQKDGVMLAMELLVREGDDYRRIGSPSIWTKYGEAAEVRFTTDDGKTFQISITPRSNPPKRAKRLRERL